MHRGAGVAAELCRIAGRIDRTRAALHELLRHGGAIDGMEDRLTHLLLGQRIVGAGAAGRIHAEILDAHRFGAHRLQVRHAGDGIELVGAELPDPVGAAAQQFGHLGGRIRHFVDDDLADRGLALRAVGVIAVVAFQIDLGDAVHLGDLVRAGANRVLRVFLRLRPSRDTPSA